MRPIGARLTLWFASIVGLCLLLVLGISYSLLSLSLREKDRELIRDRWKEYHDALTFDGIEGLEHRLLDDTRLRGENPFVVGVTEGHEILLFTPPRLPGHVDELDLRRRLPSDNRAPVWREIPVGADDSIDALTAPVEHHLILTVGKSTRDRSQDARRFLRILFFAIAPVSILGIVGGFLFSRKALRPIRDLSETARTIYNGNIGARVPLKNTGDELDELGALFNQMLERIQTLVQGMKDTLDNVAHDLRTPMTRFRGLAEMGLASTSAEMQKEALQESLDGSEEILRLLSTLMDLSSAETGTLKLNLERIDLSEVAGEAASLYQFLADEKGVALRLTAAPGQWIRADRGRTAQALANLFDNALKYTKPGGTIEGHVARRGDRVIFSISDSGCGIAPHDLPRIWDRLYRGDKSRSEKGMGLGLSIVKAIVYAHGGRIEVESTEGQGSKFEVSLPTLTAI